MILVMFHGKKANRSIGTFCRIFILASLFCPWPGHAQQRNPYDLDIILTVRDYTEAVRKNPFMQMADLEKTNPGIRLDIRYATKNNFTGAVIYTRPKAFVRLPVATALKKVQDSLAFYNIGLKMYDAYRPYAATLRFFEVYPDTTFVANPHYGSRHNRGCAIDVTLVDLTTGIELPMPSGYDEFSPKANPLYSDLPDTVLTNRKLLFGIMSHFGFSNYPSEWWHFDYEGWQEFKLMDLSFDELEEAMVGN